MSAAGPFKPGDPLLDILLEGLDHIDEVLWIRDLAEERLLYISPAFARIWGRSVEALLGNPRIWIESVHPEDRERVMGAALNNARTGRDEMEYRVIRPDGTPRWVYDRSYPIRNRQGEIYRLVGIVEDVTDKRKPKSK